MEINAMPLFGITPFEAKNMRRNKITSICMTVFRDQNQITIPKEVYETFGSPKYVEVGFNDEKKFFAVRPCEKPTKFSIELGKSNSHPIARKVIIDKIISLHPFDGKKYSLLLQKVFHAQLYFTAVQDMLIGLGTSNVAAR